MGVEIIFKIAAIGILTAIVGQVLKQTGKEEISSLKRFERSTITKEEIENLSKRKIKIEQLKIIVPSLRLDNFVSDLAKTSRTKAVQIINQERVFINRTKWNKSVKTIKGKWYFDY